MYLGLEPGAAGWKAQFKNNQYLLNLLTFQVDWGKLPHPMVLLYFIVHAVKKIGLCFIFQASLVNRSIYHCTTLSLIKSKFLVH